MNGLRHELLAGAARPEDEHVKGLARHREDAATKVPDGLALAHEPESIGSAERLHRELGLACEGGSDHAAAHAQEEELVLQRDRVTRHDLGRRDLALPAYERARAHVLDEERAA